MPDFPWRMPGVTAPPGVFRRWPIAGFREARNARTRWVESLPAGAYATGAASRTLFTIRWRRAEYSKNEGTSRGDSIAANPRKKKGTRMNPEMITRPDENTSDTPARRAR